MAKLEINSVNEITKKEISPTMGAYYINKIEEDKCVVNCSK